MVVALRLPCMLDIGVVEGVTMFEFQAVICRGVGLSKLTLRCFMASRGSELNLVGQREPGPLQLNVMLLTNY